MKQRYSSLQLPAYRHRPGETPHPILDVNGHSYGRVQFSDADSYVYGLDLFNHGYFWEAHEIWEEIWKASSPASDRAIFLQGLIQFAAACLKRAMKNKEGFQKLREKALEKVDRLLTASHQRYMRVDLQNLKSMLQNLSAEDDFEPILNLED